MVPLACLLGGQSNIKPNYQHSNSPRQECRVNCQPLLSVFALSTRFTLSSGHVKTLNEFLQLLDTAVLREASVKSEDVVFLVVLLLQVCGTFRNSLLLCTVFSVKIKWMDFFDLRFVCSLLKFCPHRSSLLSRKSVVMPEAFPHSPVYFQKYHGQGLV